MSELIVARKLTKRYGRARGIEEVDLSVQARDIFGFIGPNGAGKSTLIRCLLGLIRPSSGKAELFSLPIPYRTREILKRVGYMPSEISYYPRMRVKEVFKLSARLRRKDCERESWVLCDRFSLDPNRLVQDLSFGNKKKVAIICALQHRPELLFLDEPTAGLDPLMQRAFWDVIKERNREGATVFLSSHVLSEVQQHCRHAAIIREGRIVANDAVENLGRNAPRRIILRGLETLPEEVLRLPGILQREQHGQEHQLLYSGDLRPVVHLVGALPYSDLIIAEPELEEVFMHFYQQEGRP